MIRLRSYPYKYNKRKGLAIRGTVHILCYLLFYLLKKVKIILISDKNWPLLITLCCAVIIPSVSTILIIVVLYTAIVCRHH